MFPILNNNKPYVLSDGMYQTRSLKQMCGIIIVRATRLRSDLLAIPAPPELKEHLYWMWPRYWIMTNWKVAHRRLLAKVVLPTFTLGQYNALLFQDRDDFPPFLARYRDKNVRLTVSYYDVVCPIAGGSPRVRVCPECFLAMFPSAAYGAPLRSVTHRMQPLKHHVITVENFFFGHNGLFIDDFWQSFFLNPHFWCSNCGRTALISITDLGYATNARRPFK